MVRGYEMDLYGLYYNPMPIHCEDGGNLPFLKKGEIVDHMSDY
jgi:hypothetical protein